MPVKSEKQRRFMQGVAHGMKPYGGTGPSKEVAREMLSGDKKKKKKDKGKKSNLELALKGYKREGGLWNKIKDRLFQGAKTAKDAPEKTTPKK